MNIAELRAMKQTTAAKSGTTIADMLGKKIVLPLPAGLHECTLKELTSTPTSNALRIVVTAINDKDVPTDYSVSVNVGKTAEQNAIFLSITSYLLQQLDMDVLDFDILKSKVGQSIMVLGTENISERGTFINYSFNTDQMLAYL